MSHFVCAHWCAQVACVHHIIRHRTLAPTLQYSRGHIPQLPSLTLQRPTHHANNTAPSIWAFCCHCVASTRHSPGCDGPLLTCQYFAAQRSTQLLSPTLRLPSLYLAWAGMRGAGQYGRAAVLGWSALTVCRCHFCMRQQHGRLSRTRLPKAGWCDLNTCTQPCGCVPPGTGGTCCGTPGATQPATCHCTCEPSLLLQQ